MGMLDMLSVILYSYRLHKIGKIRDMKYFPVVRFLVLVINLIVKPQSVEVLLTWSGRWKEYNDDSFRDLRKEIHKSVDPLYPTGDYEQETIVSEKNTVTQMSRAPIRY
jgi:hypothetical protein